MVTDPVCNESVDERKAKAQGWMSEFEGQTHYFCSADCKEIFEQDPGQYVGPLNKDRDSDSKGDIFDQYQG